VITDRPVDEKSPVIVRLKELSAASERPLVAELRRPSGRAQ